MTVEFVRLDGDGVYVERVCSELELPEEAGVVLIPEGVSLFEAAAMYMVDGELVHRPKSPEPKPFNNQWRIENCPANSEIEFFDISGEEMMTRVVVDSDQDVDFSLPDPGVYEIHVTSPPPFFQSVTQIEIEKGDDNAA